MSRQFSILLIVVSVNVNAELFRNENQINVIFVRISLDRITDF